MKVLDIEITKIKGYAKNPRKNDEAVNAVANSIREFGWKQPLVIDPNTMEVIAGHTRLKAARKLGMISVPCVMADDLTVEQIKAYRLADNKTAELAEWDFDLLTDELDDILDIDMTDFGFDFTNEDKENEIIEDIPPEIDEDHEPVSKHGDIWQLGRHRLMCGDSTDKIAVDKLMANCCADLFITDPPYNVAYEGKTKEKLTIANDDMPEDSFFEFLKSVFTIATSVLKEGAGFYIWHADSEGLNFRMACKEAGLRVRQCLIWVKNTMVLGRQDYQWKHEPCLYGWKEGAGHYFTDDRTQTTVLEYDRPLRSVEHPTMKPIALIAKLILNSSKRKGAVVDLFGGSGTTMVACEELDRTCYMMEIDPRYCDVIIKRWENKAVGK